MELTILLSKVFGIYFTVMGVFLLFRRSYFRSIVNLVVEQPALRFMVGIIMFIASVFVIVSHQDWSSFNAGFISFLGWAGAVKSLLYMNLPNHAIKKLAWLKTSGTYGWIVSVLCIVLGLYLLNFAF